LDRIKNQFLKQKKRLFGKKTLAKDTKNKAATLKRLQLYATNSH